MPTFDGLYTSTIHYLSRSGEIPAYGILVKPINLFRMKDDETVMALMVIVAKNPSPQQIKHGWAVPLQDIFNDMPRTLRRGVISWLNLEGEEEPSTLVIHTGITKEELARFAWSRLMRIPLEKARQAPFLMRFITVLKLSTRSEEARARAREQAQRSTLGNSEPVAHYLKETR